MADDWRIRIELPEEGATTSLLSRLDLDLGSQARELAKELEGRRLAVSRDGNDLFVYAQSPREIEQARAVVEALAAEEGLEARLGALGSGSLRHGCVCLGTADLLPEAIVSRKSARVVRGSAPEV